MILKNLMLHRVNQYKFVFHCWDHRQMNEGPCLSLEKKDLLGYYPWLDVIKNALTFTPVPWLICFMMKKANFWRWLLLVKTFIIKFTLDIGNINMSKQTVHIGNISISIHTEWKWKQEVWGSMHSQFLGRLPRQPALLKPWKLPEESWDHKDLTGEGRGVV